MLWTVRHRWAAGARFAFHCYRHQVQLIFWQPGKGCIVMQSKEGVTQGDPLAMVLYGLTLLPLTEALQEAEPTVLQPWYPDDTAAIGWVLRIARFMKMLKFLGPHRGYFPEPAKSIIICKPEHRKAVETALAEFNFRYEEGHHYVGGFIGTTDAKLAWLKPKIEAWVYGVQELASVAKHFPQTAHAGLTMSLQSEWQYLQRVCKGIGQEFGPVEEAIRQDFLPALFAEKEPLSATHRTCTSLSTGLAGFNISDPTGSADRSFVASQDSVDILVDSLSKVVSCQLQSIRHKPALRDSDHALKG